MPGNVANAVPVGVMPQTLCAAFVEGHDYPELVTGYHDGTREMSKLADTSRRTWRVAKRLTSAERGTLKTFWDAHQAAAFLYYSPFDQASGQPVGSNYDATGASTQGRVTVVFRGSWQESAGMARVEMPQLELVEVA